MKKTITILIILISLVFSAAIVPAAFVPPAFAQGETPPKLPPVPHIPPEGSPSFWNINFGDFDGTTLRGLIIQAFIDVLGLDETEIDWFLDKGMNLYTIAILFGYTGDDLIGLMDTVIDRAIDNAVTEGYISDGMAEILKDRVDDLEARLSVLEWAGLTREEFMAMLESGMTVCDIAYELEFPFEWFFSRLCIYSVEEYQAAFEERYFLRQDYKGALISEFENRWGTWEDNFITYYNWWDNFEFNINREGSD